MGNKHTTADTDADADDPSHQNKLRKIKNICGGGPGSSKKGTAAAAASSDAIYGKQSDNDDGDAAAGGGARSPTGGYAGYIDDGENEEIVVSSNVPAAVVERTYLDPNQLAPDANYVRNNINVSVKAVNTKTKKSHSNSNPVAKSSNSNPVSGGESDTAAINEADANSDGGGDSSDAAAAEEAGDEVEAEPAALAPPSRPAATHNGRTTPAEELRRALAAAAAAKAAKGAKQDKKEKKARLEKFTKNYKVDTKNTAMYDSQMVNNHGRVITPLDSQYDPALHAQVTGASNNSMKAAAKTFSDSLKRIQGEEQPLVTLAKTTHFDVPTLRSLQDVFAAISSMDAADDLISTQELCRSTGTNPDSLLGRALFRLMDITRSNQINFRSWVTMLSHLTPAASVDEKVRFAFSLYDGNGDGFIERAELVGMLRSAMHDLSVEDAEDMIDVAFAQADSDGDKRITLEDYSNMVSSSRDFLASFTIDIRLLLAQYNVISPAEIENRVGKLKERDARQDEKLTAAPYVEREKMFMEKEEDDLQIINDVDALDIE